MMSDGRAPLQQPHGRAYEHMLEKVRYEGAYPTREKAEEAARLTLEAACLRAAQILDTQPLGGWAFGKELAARTGASLATRWDTGSVFSAVTVYAGPDLITRILRQLPSDYALLFGRAELTPAA
ncbi:DUF2267 domain-containing protein [Streptomyces sp. NPDC002550]